MISYLSNWASTRQHVEMNFLWNCTFSLGSKLVISAHKNILGMEKEETCQYINNLNSLMNWSLRLEIISNLCVLFLTLKNEDWMKKISESIKCIKKTSSFHCYIYLLMNLNSLLIWLPCKYCITYYCHIQHWDPTIKEISVSKICN